jgi:hypothetical protein
VTTRRAGFHWGVADAEALARIQPIVRPEEVRALGTAMVRIAAFWKLEPVEAATLLGVDAETWEALGEGRFPGPFTRESTIRASLLLGIFKALGSIFPGRLGRDWVRKPNAGEIFGGRSALDVMLEGGTPAILRVRRYLEAVAYG